VGNDSSSKKAWRFSVLFAAKLQRNPKRLLCGPVLHNAWTQRYESTDDRRSRRRCRGSTCVLRLLQLGCELLAREGCATQHEPQQTEENATQRGSVRTHRFTYIKRNTKLCKWTYPPCCSAIGCHAHSDCTLHANACMKKIACRRQCIGRTFLQSNPLTDHLDRSTWRPPVSAPVSITFREGPS